MTAALRRIGLYLNTVRWLRVSQLLWQIFRRVRPVTVPAAVPGEPIRSDLLAHEPARSPQPGVYEFRFLNKTRAANPEALDWHPQDVSRLWRYNLHYFDFLHWESFPAEHKGRYIDGWIEQNPVGTVDAWEAYTVSLRVVNWIKYFDTLNQQIPDHWRHSLLNQAVWLEVNLEYQVLANHLLKNIKAILFAGFAFDGPAGQRLRVKGIELFVREAVEQFFPDGGHYERSPMYHCIALEDLLDVCSLLNHNSSKAEENSLRKLQLIAKNALDFLVAVTGADTKIPLFNDSAYGIAVEPYQLLAYGERVLGCRQPESREPGPVIIELSSSGYFGYRHGGDSLLIDCGDIGPDYQPGHAHCDTLSYVLCVDGEPLVIDSGVSGYEDNELRSYVRSTEAHNTIRVAGQEQSEIWGTFRVARRARARLLQFGKLADGELLFSGSHNGYRRLSPAVEHKRDIVADTRGRWEFIDHVSGNGQSSAVSFIHFHPDVELSEQSPGVWLLSRAGRAVGRITVRDGADVTEQQQLYCPEFGLQLTHTVLAIQVAGSLPLQISYEIDKLK